MDDVWEAAVYWYGEKSLFEEMENPFFLEGFRVSLFYSEAPPGESEADEIDEAEALPSDGGEGWGSSRGGILEVYTDPAVTGESLDRGLPGAAYLPPLVVLSPDRLSRILPLLRERGADFCLSRDPQILRTRILANLQRNRQIREYRELVDLQNRQMTHLLEALPDIVYQLDEEGRLTYVNEAVRGLGYSPGELTGRHFSVLMEPEEAALVSRQSILYSFAGRKTGNAYSPGLFDERRGPQRKTERLEVRLKVHPAHPRSQYQRHIIGSVTAYGEITRGSYEDEGPDGAFHRQTVGVIRDITEQREGRRRLQMLFQGMDQTPEMAAMVDNGGRVEYTNPAFYRRFALAPGEELPGVPRENGCPVSVLAAMRNALLAEGKQEQEIPGDPGSPSDGPAALEAPWFRMESSPITDFEGHKISTLFLITDITAEKEAGRIKDEELAAKTRLLDEIHHRVKNNLQVVSSFLHMQEGMLKDPEDVILLRESQARIRSMALVHDQLNRTESKESIPLKAFAESLFSHLSDIYQPQDRPSPYLRLDVAGAVISLNQVTPLALMMTEILSNTFKYAFPSAESLKGRQPEVRIVLERKAPQPFGGRGQGEAVLIMGDNGIGLSPEKERTPQGSGLGCRLIRELAEQMGATVTRLEEQPGTVYALSFSLPPE